MKALITAIGICALFALPGAAYGATAYTLNQTNKNWDGATQIWTGGSAGDHPSAAGDTAAFSAVDSYLVKVGNSFGFASATATRPATVRFLNSGAYKLTMTGGLSVDASSRAATLTQVGQLGDDGGEWEMASLTLTAGATAGYHAKYLLSDGTLDVQGTATLTGDANNDADAIIEVSDGATFAAYALDLRGDTDSTDGYAVLIFNESVTVDSGNNHTNPDTLMEGFVDVTLGDNTTFDAHDVSLNANTDLQVTGTHVTRSIYTFDSQTYDNAADVTFSGPLRVEG